MKCQLLSTAALGEMRQEEHKKSKERSVWISEHLFSFTPTAFTIKTDPKANTHTPISRSYGKKCYHEIIKHSCKFHIIALLTQHLNCCLLKVVN